MPGNSSGFSEIHKPVLLGCLLQLFTEETVGSTFMALMLSCIQSDADGAAVSLL